jgi:hypothetical protein
LLVAVVVVAGEAVLWVRGAVAQEVIGQHQVFQFYQGQQLL